MACCNNLKKKNRSDISNPNKNKNKAFRKGIYIGLATLFVALIALLSVFADTGFGLTIMKMVV